MGALAGRCNPDVLIRIGLVFLILASLSGRLLPRLPMTENLADGLQGLLFGVSIGALLLGLWRRGR